MMLGRVLLRFVLLLLVLGMSHTRVFASEITLQTNVTSVYYFQPNVGANFADLLTPDAFFIFEGVKYHSFSLSGISGPDAPALSDLWFVFNPNSGNYPMIVTDPSIVGVGSFDVGWSVTAPESYGFDLARLLAADLDSGTGDVGGGTIVTSRIASNGQLLGTQKSESGGDCNPCVENLNLHFAPQKQLDMSFHVDVSGDARFTAFAEEIHLARFPSATPVPEPSSLSLLVCALAGFAVARRRKPLGG
jgi:hypothetical protein